MNVQKSSLYQPFNNYQRSNEENFEEIVTKGGNKVFKVNIGHFDNLCHKFRLLSDVKIKNLQGVDRDDFNLMVSYVQLLYGTNYYTHFYEKVRKHFSNLEKIIPGTVGNYFAGCLNSSIEIGEGCPVACTGSIPKPRGEEGWSFCDKAVIFADKVYQGYEFTFLKEPVSSEDVKDCYLFVEAGDLKDFEGFNQDEKEELKKMGAENIHLIGYTDHGNVKYTELYSNVVNVRNIKHRYIQSDSNTGLIIFTVFMFILFAIGIIFINN